MAEIIEAQLEKENDDELMPSNFPWEMYSLDGEKATVERWYKKYAESNDTLLHYAIKERPLKCLDHNDWEVKVPAFYFAKGMDDEEKKTKIKEFILEALDYDDWYMKRTVFHLAKGMNDEKIKTKIKEFILEALDDYNWDIRAEAAHLAKGMNDEKIKTKIKKILKSHFEGLDITSQESLYENIKEDSGNGFEKRLDKDGSKTILLDKIPFSGEKSIESFKGKIIMRVIGLEHFLAWKKAFEAYDVWKELGFDYVPVEPILSFRMTKDLKVNVYTAVLDNSVGNLQLMIDPRLIEGLRRIRIKHGHFHANNVCTYFERDKKGNPILDKMPRQYIIDFDQAEINENIS